MLAAQGIHTRATATHGRMPLALRMSFGGVSFSIPLVDRFPPMPIPVSDEPHWCFENMPLPLLCSVVPVFSKSNGEWKGLGSAFCVSVPDAQQAVFLTVAHLADDLGDNPTLAVGIPRAPGQPPAIDLCHVTCLARADFGLLDDSAALVVHLSDSAMRPVPFGLSLSMPALGTPTQTFGYPKIKTTRWDEATKRGKGIQNLCASTGRVEDLVATSNFPANYSKTVGSFPFLQTSAPCPSGMSGGPVLDADWNVVGVLSTSSEHEPTYSRCALIATYLPMRLVLESPQGPREVTLSHLMTSGQVPITGGPCTYSIDHESRTISVTWP